MRREEIAGARLLVVDDQPKTAELLARLAPSLRLLPAGSGRSHARSWREAAPFFARAGRLPDLVVLDLRFEIPDDELLPEERELGDAPAARRLRRERRDRQGLYILERIRHAAPDLPVVLTTAHEEIPFEEEALRLRADAFTWSAGEEEATGEGILRLVTRVLLERDAPAATGSFLWGRGAAMRDLRRRIGALAPTPLPLLLTGPTGTGKSFLAREVIHPLSGRKGPFVTFDCATVPETLLPAALFGSVRGSYTGAVADRPGVFEAAAGGTLFLDEVENLSADAQKALLTALHDGTVRRIGEARETPHTARVVAATNADLARRVAEGSFRDDLLMRLNPALALRLPALAERPEDLADLARLSAARFFADAGHRREIAAQVRAAGGAEPAPHAPMALAVPGVLSPSREAAAVFVLPRKAWLAMTRHPWPGNLRQLEMVVLDLLSAALYAREGPAVDGSGRAAFALDARLLFELLAESRGKAPGADERLSLPWPRATTVEGFRRELERTAYRELFREAKGDFAALAERLTGRREEARAARLRFNRLGLSARRER